MTMNLNDTHTRYFEQEWARTRNNQMPMCKASVCLFRVKCWQKLNCELNIYTTHAFVIGPALCSFVSCAWFRKLRLCVLTHIVLICVPISMLIYTNIFGPSLISINWNRNWVWNMANNNEMKENETKTSAHTHIRFHIDVSKIIKYR